MNGKLPQSIKFDRNKELLGVDSAVGVVIEGTTDPGLAQALLADDPFPPGDFELGSLSVAASAGKDIQFDSAGRGSVSFSAGAQTAKGLAVYSDPRALLKQLAPAQNIAPGIEFAEVNSSRYVMLKWAYDIKAAAKGSLALLGGAGSLKFGVEAGREALYAVIRKVPEDTGARTALAETINSWMLPRQVDALDDLEPGTWIVSEVDGTVAASLGVQFGYDYNWIREAKLGGLSGDIGLRIQLAVGATLGFTASGRYAVVVSRASTDPAEKQLRLRLFRLSKKGWNFAFNAGASIQADFSDFLPDRADDFIAAVFGVSGPQIVKDLQSLEEWTDPSKPLPETLSMLGVDYVNRLLQDVTGIDPEQEFEKARSLLLDVFERWDNLGHSVATQLWSLLQDSSNSQIKQLSKLAKAISEADEESIKQLVGKELQKVDFFTSPTGKWLESVASKGILTLLTDREEMQALRQAATLTASLLDGSAVEKVIRNLQAVVEQRLNLEQVRQVVSETSFEDLDEWLKAKLAEFLGSNLDFSKLEEIKETINLLLSKREEFYQKALEALNRQYNFQVAASYQMSSTRTALLDISFDFSSNVNRVKAALRDAIDGQYDKLLVKPTRGVRLNLATLTHEISRQSHVELTMPYYSRKVTNINRSLAKVSATDDDGRVLVYELDAQDILASVTRGKSARDSRLAITANLPVPANRTRIHSAKSLTYSYSLRQFKRGAKTADLQYQLKPYVRRYLPGAFGGTADGQQRASFDTWIGDLDKATDQIRDNGTGNLGDALVSLELSVPSEVVAAWTQSPGKNSSRFPLYLSMSRHLQQKLKELLPFYYFQDLEKYGELGSAAPLLVYAAIPPSNAVKLRSGRLVAGSSRDVYWNWPDPQLRRAMASSSSTAANLATAVERIHNLLESSGFDGIARFYKPGAGTVRRLISTATEDFGERLLTNLLFVEARVVRGAMEAGVEFAKFRAKARTKPSEAIEALAKFGQEITTTFNKKIASIYGGGGVRPFGTLVFTEAALALDPSLSVLQPAAMLSLAILKEDAGVSAETILSQRLKPEDILLQEHIVST